MKETKMERNLRRIVASVVVCLLALTTTGSAAMSRRVVEKSYTMADGMVTGSGWATWTIASEWKVFRPRAGERSVVFSIVDAVGPSVRGHVHMDVDGDGDMDDARDFCSKSKSIPVKPGQRIEVAVLLGECPGGEPSVVTEGTITATFSK